MNPYHIIHLIVMVVSLLCTSCIGHRINSVYIVCTLFMQRILAQLNLYWLIDYGCIIDALALSFSCGRQQLLASGGGEGKSDGPDDSCDTKDESTRAAVEVCVWVRVLLLVCRA